MKRILVSLMCLIMMIFSIPVSASAAINDGILTLPEDDGTGYPVTGIADQYSHDGDIYKVIVPDNIIRLGEEAFFYCSNLSEIKLNSNLQLIGENAFTGTAYYEDPNNWESGVLYIGDCLIKADPKAIGDHYEIQDGTRLIACSAFKDCESLNSIVIPSTVEYVGTDAFSNTGFYNNLSNWDNGLLYLDHILIATKKDEIAGKVKIKDCVRTVADSAFIYCSDITEVICPDSIVHIGTDAFWDCHKLTKVRLGAKVKTLGRGPFRFCTELLEIDVDEQNEHFAVVDGILYNKELSHVIRCPQKITGKVILPISVTKINAYAFEWCTELQYVEIPKGCIFIGNSAFSVCENLTDLVILEGMEYIDQYAFSYCNNIKSVVIPDSVYNLGSYSFACCMKLNDATLGNGITFLKNGLFESCENLNYVELGNDITEISNTAFRGTKYISNVANYQNGLLIASEKYLIRVAGDVVECKIPYGITLIADGAFELPAETGNLRSLSIPHSLISINWDAFYDVPDDVPVYYDGTIYDFIRVTDFDWDFLNLYTEDYYSAIRIVIILWSILAAFVIAILAYNRIQKKNLNNKENSYGHQ